MRTRGSNPFRSDHDGRSIFSRPLVAMTIFFLLLSMLSIVPGSVRAVTPTIEVDDDAASGWYDATHVRTITEAIANASTGFNIRVHPGTYAESVTVNKKVDIASTNGAAVTTVSSAASRAIYVTASFANVTGFTVTGGASTAISIDLHHVNVTDCVISGVQRGIEVKGQYATIEGCTVTGYQTNGIYVQYGQHTEILNTTVQNVPLVEVNSGISIMAGSNILIRNCSLLDNTQSGITASDTNGITLDANSALGNGKGIVLGGCEGVVLRNNTMTGNGWDLRVTGTTQAELSPDIDASNQVTNGPVRYYVGQPGVTVDTSAGFLALVDCDDVTVSDMSFSHNGQGVLVAFSDDVELTNLDIDACEYGVYFLESDRLRMEGIAINGSDATGIRGMYGESPFFGNCTVLNTGTEDFDDGAYLYDMPRATFYRCNISDSGGYGIYLGNGHNASVVDCNFWYDVGGVGVYLVRANDSVVRNNTVYGCEMGIDVQDSHRSIVEENRALYNNVGSSRIGIGVIESNDALVRNNTAIGHTYGLWIRDLSNAQVTGNIVEECGWYGIWVRGSSEVTVSGNVFESSSTTYYSVTLDAATSNTMVVNNKIMGPRCAKDEGSGNVWNTAKTLGTNIVGGPYLGGNYYSDYNGSDANLDGIGDTPYAIAGGISTDQLPLFQSAVPGPPRNLVATPGNAQVSLQWLAPADDGGNPITNYTLYRGPTAGSLSPLVTLGVALSYLDTSVTNDQTYYYGVTATNAVGEGAISNVVPATPSVPLNWPTVTILSPGNSSYNHGTTWLNWTGSDPVSAIAYYEVQLDDQAWIDKSVAVTHTFSLLSAGSHQLKVRAWNTEGRSRTAWVTVTTDLTPPTVQSYVPTGQNESVSVLIRVTMSETMLTFTATVNGASATVSWNGLVATLTPSIPLQQATEYQVRVNGTDLSGLPMSELVYEFRTAASPPGDGGNMDWMWIVIIIVIVLALLFFFLIFWKRRKEDEEEEKKRAK